MGTLARFVSPPPGSWRLQGLDKAPNELATGPAADDHNPPREMGKLLMPATAKSDVQPASVHGMPRNRGRNTRSRRGHARPSVSVSLNGGRGIAAEQYCIVCCPVS